MKTLRRQQRYISCLLIVLSLPICCNTQPLLGLCKGGCNGDDSACEIGLSCFVRGRREPVPGCEAESSFGSRGEDFCYEPPAGVLVYIGNNQGGLFKPESALPLQPCEGDCDGDETCDEGMICYPRKGNEKVPGCHGKGVTGIDYCYDPASPTDGPPTIFNVLADVEVTSDRHALENCQGNCEANDSLCKFGLSCFVRDRKEYVPGCQGRGQKGNDYCHVPPRGVLVHVGNRVDGVTTPEGAVFPLDVCQGNCHNNDDCRLGLHCSKKVQFASVPPGCLGLGIRDVHYCFNPNQTLVDQQQNTTSPTTTPTIAPGGEKELTFASSASSIFSLNECHGDCARSDELCKPGLSCFARDATEMVPNCQGSGLSGTSYCYKPPEDVLVFKGEASEHHESVIFPLGVCQGHCVDDWDCDDELKCFERNELEAVPGCKGDGIRGRNYCYMPGEPTDVPPEVTVSASSGEGGNNSGLPNAAVISIIVVSVVVANICLCICCKWLLSRDPTDVRGKNSTSLGAPQLDADGGVLIQSVQQGSGVNTDNNNNTAGESSNERSQHSRNVQFSGTSSRQFSHMDSNATQFPSVDNTNEIT